MSTLHFKFSFFFFFIRLAVLPPAGVDYVGISRNLDFAPGVSMQTFKVTILDDLGQPELEGTESFELVLRMPANGILGEPGKATVFINDSVSDCKSFLTFYLRVFLYPFFSMALAMAMSVFQFICLSAKWVVQIFMDPKDDFS